jgi:hypothetical protein
MRHSFVKHCLLLQRSKVGIEPRLHQDMEELQTSGRSVASALYETLPLLSDAAGRGGYRSGKPACPYELRLIHFTRFPNPSTMPLLQDSVQPLATASASSASELDKVDQFCNATGPDGCFPVFQSVWTFSLPRDSDQMLEPA